MGRLCRDDPRFESPVRGMRDHWLRGRDPGRVFQQSRQPLGRCSGEIPRQQNPYLCGGGEMSRGSEKEN